MAPTDTLERPTGTSPQPTPHSTRGAALRALREETGCSWAVADGILYMVEHLKKPGDLYHLSEDDLKRLHHTFAQAIPDDTHAKPGSAHDLINKHISPNGTCEVMHIQEGATPSWCATELQLMRR